MSERCPSDQILAKKNKRKKIKVRHLVCPPNIYIYIYIIDLRLRNVKSIRISNFNAKVSEGDTGGDTGKPAIHPQDASESARSQNYCDVFMVQSLPHECLCRHAVMAKPLPHACHQAHREQKAFDMM